MTLLDVGRETVIIYHAEAFTSSDGNTIYRPSAVGETVTNCAVQLASQSGTSARRAEQDDEGYFTEEVYRFRPPRSYTTIISSNAQVEWQGVRWSIIGKAKRFNGSSRTAHIDYTIRRT